jgi:hypothetical protein
MDLLLESLTNAKVAESGRRTRAKTFTGPHSRFRGSIKGASFVCRGGSIYVTIRASRIEDLLALGDRRLERASIILANQSVTTF